MKSEVTRWRVAIVFAACTGLVQCGPALEPTGVLGAEALVRSGLIGHWAVNCDAEYTTENPHLIYAISDKGDPNEKLLMDQIRNRTTPLRDIRELKGNMIEWVQPWPGGTMKVVTKVEGRRHKTWSSVLSSGATVVDQGRYEGGGEALWFNKCDEG